MAFNRIAIYGHRGWASSAVTDALIASGAPIKVIYRPGSDVTSLPSTVSAVEVDVNDTQALIDALTGVDIVISLVGQEGVERQFEFIKAIPSTNVQLFVPSDLGYKADERLSKIPALAAKGKVEQASKDAGIPTTVVRPGNMVESTFSVPLVGVDVAENKVVYSGDSENQPLVLCSRKYIAAAYASIFAQTPISQIQNRAIGLTELVATGSQIAAALERKHGAPPQIFRHSLEQLDEEIVSRSAKGDRLALCFAYRYPWGNGEQQKLVGDDIWDVEGFEKGDLDKYIVRGEREAYKEFPPPFAAAIRTTFY